jgi:hypothetical protein
VSWFVPTQKIFQNKSNCFYWFYVITAICFGPHWRPSSGSFIKYVSRYWNIHVIVNPYNHNTCNIKIVKIFDSFLVAKNKRLSYPCNRPWRPIGLWDVEAPTFCRQSAHRWWWGCQPYALAAFYPQEDSWYSFLLKSDPIPVRLEGLGQFKNPRPHRNSNPRLAGL